MPHSRGANNASARRRRVLEERLPRAPTDRVAPRLVSRPKEETQDTTPPQEHAREAAAEPWYAGAYAGAERVWQRAGGGAGGWVRVSAVGTGSNVAVASACWACSITRDSTLQYHYVYDG